MNLLVDTKRDVFLKFSSLCLVHIQKQNIHSRINRTKDLYGRITIVIHSNYSLSADFSS